MTRTTTNTTTTTSTKDVSDRLSHHLQKDKACHQRRRRQQGEGFGTGGGGEVGHHVFR